jgi:hypothetical protein
MSDRREGKRCAFCGHPEQLHRTRDTQWERIAAGDHIADVADDYDGTVPAMVAMWTGIDERLVELIGRLRADDHVTIYQRSDKDG